jgi:hypothetical protein
MTTNADRAQRAAQVAIHFSEYPDRCGERYARPRHIDPMDVSDLLADLMHLCTVRGFDWEELIGSAQDNYHAEMSAEREVNLQDYSEDDPPIYTDKNGGTWMQFYKEPTFVNGPRVCAFCRCDINAGWHGVESGEDVCNGHITLPITEEFRNSPACN